MTEDLFKQAEADFLRAKARAEETAAAVLRAQADDAKAQAELARMQNVLDWIVPRRPPEQDEPQEHAPTPAPALPRRASRKPARSKKNQKNMSDLVEDAVRQIGGFVQNAEIAARLKRQGYDFTPLQVRGSAKHLAQKGRLVSGGYGIWAVPEDAPRPEKAPQDDVAPAAPVAGASQASENNLVPAGAAH